MSGVQATLARRRGEQSSLNQSLEDADRNAYRNVLHIIKDKQVSGISHSELKRVSMLPPTQFNKTITKLVANQLIKEVPNIKSRGGQHYMGAEFESSKELTGGYWYADGKLDHDLINNLKRICLKILQLKLKVATAEGVLDFMVKSRCLKGEVSIEQIEEILRSMVLDNEILEVKSTGLAEYHSIPVGEVCYRCATGGGIGEALKTAAMVSIPCGVCPRISSCTPDGVISPTNCVYYKKWLDF